MKTYSISAERYRDEISIVSGYFSEASALAVIIQNIITGHLKVEDREKYKEIYDRYIECNVKCEVALDEFKQKFLGDIIMPGCRCYVGFNNASFNVLDMEENDNIEKFLLERGFIHANKF